jgi:hypothetical protein
LVQPTDDQLGQIANRIADHKPERAGGHRHHHHHQGAGAVGGGAGQNPTPNTDPAVTPTTQTGFGQGIDQYA